MAAGLVKRTHGRGAGASVTLKAEEEDGLFLEVWTGNGGLRALA